MNQQYALCWFDFHTASALIVRTIFFVTSHSSKERQKIELGAECILTFSVDAELGSNGLGCHVAEHLLLQLGVHLVCDGHHVWQQFAVFDLAFVFVQGGKKTNLQEA